MQLPLASPSFELVPRAMKCTLRTLCRTGQGCGTRKGKSKASQLHGQPPHWYGEGPRETSGNGGPPAAAERPSPASGVRTGSVRSASRGDTTAPSPAAKNRASRAAPHPQHRRACRLLATALRCHVFLPLVVVENIVREVIVNELFKRAPVPLNSHPICRLA